jgi:hypothetical protein
MSAQPVSGEVEEAVAALGAALDRLTGLALYPLSQEELLTLVRQFETIRRRIPVVDHALVSELEARSVAEALGARNTQAVLRDVLRLSPSEANARVQAAHRLGRRETVTGEVLEPVFRRVAAAQATGAVSVEQARVITMTIEELPATVRAEHGESVEQTLVEAASRFDPVTLGKLGRHLHAVLDPDGTLATEEDQQRRRAATLTPNRDGSGTSGRISRRRRWPRCRPPCCRWPRPGPAETSATNAAPRNASMTRSTPPRPCCCAPGSSRRRAAPRPPCCSP